MTKNILQTLVMVLSSSLLLSFTIHNRNYQTECVTIGTDGYVTIKIWDTKKEAKYKLDHAQKDALHAILFSGISSSAGCTAQPPILNEDKEQDNFKSIEKKFFTKKGKWSSFTRSSNPPNTLEEQNNGLFQITIAKDELRKYLEEKNVIKSLSNGF